MNLKQLIGSQAYWIVNKELAMSIGLHETILLQHLVDLADSFFKKGEPFYQQQSRLVNDLPLSEHQIRKATKVLVDKGFITAKRSGIPPKYHYGICEDNLYRFFNLTYKHEETESLKVKKVDKKHQELTLTETIDNNTKLVDTTDDILGKIFFKIVEFYPKNRIGNRQHGLKKFKQLDIDQAKLAAKNLKRYLTVAGQYVKSLQNYIDQECYSEAWLKAEEETKQKQNNITENKTKTFIQDYDNIS
jgi:hypothetical protein